MDTVNQLLFATEKILQDSWEPRRGEYLYLDPCCNNNTGLDKAYLRKLVVANQYISSTSQTNVVVNNSWFTVPTFQCYVLNLFITISYEKLCLIVTKLSVNNI